MKLQIHQMTEMGFWYSSVDSIQNVQKFTDTKVTRKSYPGNQGVFGIIKWVTGIFL